MSDPLSSPTAPGTPDKAGVPFDPAIHAKYRSGRAMRTRAGLWFSKGGKGGGAPLKPSAHAGPKGETTPSPKGGVPDPFGEWEQPPVKTVETTPSDAVAKPVAEPSPTPTQSTLGSVPGDPVDAAGQPAIAPAAPDAGEVAAKARALVSAIETTGRMFFGADLEHTADERDALSAAWVRYFEANGGGPEISPGMGVALGYFALVSTRVERPTFRARCAALWNKMSGGKKL